MVMSRARSRSYSETAVHTATPAGQLVLLLDQLDANLDRAGLSLDSGDLAGSHQSLMGAQAAVALLRDSLREDVWDGARDLKILYHYVLDKLVWANMDKDRQHLRDAELVIRPLIAAWRQAAEIVAGEMSGVSGG